MWFILHIFTCVFKLILGLVRLCKGYECPVSVRAYLQGLEIGAITRDNTYKSRDVENSTRSKSYSLLDLQLWLQIYKIISIKAA